MATQPTDLIQKAIDKIVAKEPGWKAFAPKPAVGAKPGATSTGRPASTSRPSLEESDAALREYFATRTVTSSDGLLTIEYAPIKSITFVGGAQMIFKEPPP